MTADLLEPLLDVHLKGAFHVTRPAWQVMREQRYGRVVNTCSAAGILGAERMSNYRSEEHTSELQSQFHLVCRLLLEKKKNIYQRCNSKKKSNKERSLLTIPRSVKYLIW